MNVNAKPTYCVDLAKNKFQVHTFSARGEVQQRRTLTRAKFDAFFSNPNTPRGMVVMEACASSQFWARRFVRQGHEARLLPAQFVAKHRIGNKNDGNDADAIWATHQDARVKSVPVKSVEQQDACAWHRLRERLVTDRTQCINQIRGLLAERGRVAGKGRLGLSALVASVDDSSDEVTPVLARMIGMIHQQIEQIDQQIDAIECELNAMAKRDPVAKRVMTIHGIGVITATAMAAETGGRVERFADARQFAAGIGITPREDSTGETWRLGPITRRGNPYLRWLLVQCGQSVVQNCRSRDDAISKFAMRLLEDKHKKHNTVVVAVANHLARIVYAVIKHGEDYRPQGRIAARA